MQSNPHISEILGAMGRHGDDMIAHLRKGGEMIIPLDSPEAFGGTIATFAKEVANANKKRLKDNDAGKKRSAETLEKFEPKKMLDLRDFIAGLSNPERINPLTGAEEYFSADDSASEDAAAEGVGGGTGVGGVDSTTAAADAAQSEENTFDGMHTNEQAHAGFGAFGGDGFDQTWGYGLIDARAEAVMAQARADAMAQARSEAVTAQANQEEEDAFGGMHTNEQASASFGAFDGKTGFQTFMETPLLGRKETTPVKAALAILGQVVPGVNALTTVVQGLEAVFGPGEGGNDVSAYGASIGDVGTTQGPDSGFGGGGSQGTGAGATNDPAFETGSGGLPTASLGTGLPASTATQPQRPARLDIPQELLPYLNPGMTDQQLRAVIATGALYNSNPVYRSQQVKEYYNNLVQRMLIDDSGNFNDLSSLLPVERQYVRQSRGAENYQPTGESFLSALGASPARRPVPTAAPSLTSATSIANTTAGAGTAVGGRLGSNYDRFGTFNPFNQE